LNDSDPCPDAETLAAFLDGKLRRAEIPPVLAHVDTCARCMRAVVSADSESDSASEAVPRRWPWIAIAAAILLALLTIPAIRNTSPEERLVKLAPRSARVLEPRLSGDFAWAPWRGPMRSTERATDPERLQLAGAAGDLVARADREKSADAQRDAGVALVMIEEPLAAVSRLHDSASREPDAKVWSDLAAAKYAAAMQLERPSLYPEALADADRALRIDPRLPAALFNRALILEQLGLTTLAREAWQRYLAVDASSPWATEARERLARLPETTVESEFKRDLPRFEVAAVARENVDAFVARHRVQTRAFGEAEHLGLWGEAELRGDAGEASRRLTIARATGDALARLSGESLLRDAVAAIDGADPQRRRRLAEAHRLYRRGRMAYGRQRPSDAESDLRESARQFDAARSPMALVARYYAACTRYDRNDVSVAENELEELLAEVNQYERYVALGAQVRWQLALCLMSRDDWGAALPVVIRAENAFRRLDERSNLGFVQTLRADTLLSLGRIDDSWAARIESFRIQSAEGRSDRLPVSIGGAARMELRAGRLDAARAMLELEASAAIGSDHLLANAQMRESLLASVLGDRAAASAHARESAATAQRIGDEGLRQRAVADARFAEGAVLLSEDPRRAHDALTFAIDAYERTDRTHFLPEAHLLRGRALLRIGDEVRAAEELARGMARLEEHPITFAGPVVGTGIFDAGRALYREAIALALNRKDHATALGYAERSHTRVGQVASAAEIQHRLRGSGAAIVEIVTLGDEVATFCITESALTVDRQQLARAQLAALAASAANGAKTARAKLYDSFFRPAQCLSEARHLIVVADPELEGVAFGALFDSTSRTYLIERIPVSMALNASSLRSGEPPRRQSVLTVEVPSGEQAGTLALPRASREMAEVRAMYPRASESVNDPIAAADVIHIAGHTARAPGTGDATLRFDGRNPQSWTSIAARASEPGSTVVLAACETLRRPRAYALSLGGGFLAAGAADVIGTLDFIADEDAYDLFRHIHRELAAGVAADEAVRRAQLTALRSGRAIDWAAVAVLTQRIPQ